jgi:chromosome segregation ATPase
MIEGTSDEKLNLLKEDVQRARAEQEAERALRRVEIDAEKQARAEAAQGRHDNMMNQLRAMRELLHEQRESQAERVEQMERRHAEEVRRHETTLGQMSDVQAAVSSFRDERRAHSAQLAEERARAKAGGSNPTHGFDCRSDDILNEFYSPRRRSRQASVRQRGRDARRDALVGRW